MKGKHQIRRAILGRLEQRLAARFELVVHASQVSLLNKTTMQFYGPADTLHQITAAEYAVFEADTLGRDLARRFTQQFPDGPQVQ
jgi:hypothetical protein